MNQTHLLELGTLIREAREKSGLSQGELAESIKVSQRILGAIESGSTDGLPHAVYTRGFVRSYALAVGIAPEVLAPLLDAVFTDDILANVNPELSSAAREQAMNPRNNLMALAAVLLIVALLAGIGVGGWFIVDNYGSDLLNFIKKPFSAVSDVPDENAPAEEAPSGQTGAPQSQNRENALQSPAPSGLAQNIPAPADEDSEAQADPSGQHVAASPALQPPAVSESSVAASVQTAKHALAVSAKENCWVDFTADGVHGRDFTIKKGETHTFSFEKSLQIVLGNAPGVTLRYDGSDYKFSVPSGTSKVSLNFPRQGQ